MLKCRRGLRDGRIEAPNVLRRRNLAFSEIAGHIGRRGESNILLPTLFGISLKSWSRPGGDGSAIQAVALR